MYFFICESKFSLFQTDLSKFNPLSSKCNKLGVRVIPVSLISFLNKLVDFHAVILTKLGLCNDSVLING